MTRWKANIDAEHMAKKKLVVISKRDGGFGNYQRAKIRYLKDLKIHFSVRNVERLETLNATINSLEMQASG